MHTRLTDLLGIEHPVMLAGMGGVSYAELAAAVSAAGGFGCLGASTMGNETMVAEMAAIRAATDKPFGVDLLTAMPGGMTEQVEMIIEGGASAFVAGLGVPTEVVDLCHRHGLFVVSMCGKVDHAVRAVEAGLRPGGGPGHRSGWAHRKGGLLPPGAPDRRRRRGPRAGGGGRRDLRRPRPRCRPVARGRRHLGRHAVHRHARGSGRARVQGEAAREPRGRDDGQPRLFGQDHAASSATRTPTTTTPIPTSSRSSPSS